MNSLMRLAASAALLLTFMLIVLLPGCGDAGASTQPAASASDSAADAHADAAVPADPDAPARARRMRKPLTAGQMRQDYLGYPSMQ